MRAFETATGRRVETVGVVSSHGWIEDMGQAWWLASLLNRRGVHTVVGDVRDLAVFADGGVRLRGQHLDALYRWYPVERLYRHGVFAPLMEAVVDQRLLLLNGLRGFLAQSKAAIAYLWLNRADPSLTRADREAIEQHLPPIVPARRPEAGWLRPDSVVKHVNGREGYEVSFGATLSPDEWDSRLLEGGYVVQRRVEQVPVQDVALDDWQREISVVEPRYACVGAFCIGGRFGGCYTRVGGPITQSRSAFLPTLVESQRSHSSVLDGAGARSP
jgi:glutathionylspermidine synthase